jgi:hypothetical protein
VEKVEWRDDLEPLFSARNGLPYKYRRKGESERAGEKRYIYKERGGIRRDREEREKEEKKKR